MNFQKYDLGPLSAGEIVEIKLVQNAANVRLMDSSNFSNYRAGRRHQYIGGYMTKSPVRLQIPHSGHWYVAIDLGGYSGTVRSSVRVLPGRLPTMNDAPLSSVPSLIRDPIIDPNGPDPTPKEYDVFISHASEDKDAIVRSLADALVKGGLRVWYDEFELKIGDSLRRKIDNGLAHSRFGIVVLSQAFFKKGWPNYELDGLVTRAVSGDQILLPIWHNISKNEVVEYSPSLADKVARSTANYTIEEIATEIIEVIREHTNQP
ncbi:MAG: DUF1883 domain-containing protein [Chloroflexi bacterium]|nr:DUF1883 domain-containing protein [Chloroflexota bacterium]